MSWDPVWENIFVQRDGSKYPPEELVRFIAKNYYSAEERKAIKILEIGCGPGAGPGWFIAREGFSYYGIDGSSTAIKKAEKRFLQEGLRGEFRVGDVEKLPWESETFDCVIDRGCLQCNDENATARILEEVRKVLKKNGMHFSITSCAGSWGDGSGVRVDSTTYQDITEGPFKSMGAIRFATRESLTKLYAGFEEVHIEHSIRSINDGQHEVSNWIVTCKK